MSAHGKVDGPRCLELAHTMSRCGDRLRPYSRFGQDVLEALSGLAWEAVYRRGMPDGLVPEGTPSVEYEDYERPLMDRIEDDLARVVDLLSDFLPNARASLEQGDSGQWTASVRSKVAGPPAFAMTCARPSRALLWAALLHAGAMGSGD